jgi:hypothetical protein
MFNVLQEDLGYYAGRWVRHCESIILNYCIFVIGKIVVVGDSLIPI